MKMRHSNRMNAGFTLVELLIAVAVTAIVLTALVSVFSSQQRMFTNQSELAKTQAGTRISLLLLARDIRMAGYLGIPLGFDIMAANPSRANVIALKNDSTFIQNYPTASFGNGLNTNSDVIEVLGNFVRRTARLTQQATPAGTQINVDDNSAFRGTGLSKPGWLALGPVSGQGNVELLQITTVPGGTASYVNVASAPANTYDVDDTIVAPVFKRIYYVNAQADTLNIVNCEDDDCSSNTDRPMATGVDDMQVTYITDANPADGVVDTSVEMFCDPCTVRGVKIILWTKTRQYEQGRQIMRKNSTVAKIRNLAFNHFSCSLPGCTF